MSSDAAPSAPDASAWSFVREGAGGVVTVGDKRYPTDYSREIVEAIVRRKGVARMPRYLRYREERAPKLAPLLAWIDARGKPVRVLEPGCSAGHLSEVLLRSRMVEKLVSFDPDAGMIDVCLAKKAHFGLERWEPRIAATPDFTDETFDLVLMSAMIEHVDPRVRRALVDACWSRLAPGGLLVVLESQNRYWPFEYHVIGLPIPWAHYLPPRIIYTLCRIFGRYGPEWSYEEFANPNTGWWGATRREFFPADGAAADASREFGYGEAWYRAQWRERGSGGRLRILAYRLIAALLRLLGIAPENLLPAHYVALRKIGG
ncbi:class I SAM-dependent methyltransferase [bacterium]|nr:class I SAM-dependent methyltransferase [bacterium]